MKRMWVDLLMIALVLLMIVTSLINGESIEYLILLLITTLIMLVQTAQINVLKKRLEEKE